MRLRPRCGVLLAVAALTVPLLLALLALLTSRDPGGASVKHASVVDVVYFEARGGASDGEVRPPAAPSAADSLEAGARRMAARRRLLSTECAALLPEQRLNPREFVVSTRPSIVFCPVVRAASASWLANMLRFKGARLPRTCGRANLGASSPPTELLRRLFPRPSVAELTRALATSPSLLIVRHPLDRLLSAFRDAEQNEDFPAFARRLLAANRTELRWPTVAKSCTPCAAEFGYIAKVETLAADQRYLLLAEPALADAGATAQWCHPSRRGLPTSPELSARYFASLPSGLVRELAALYAEDMRLFGYSLRGYLGDN